MSLSRDERRALKLVNVGGVLVERDALRIAERIKEYDPNLTLQFLAAEASALEPPFRVVETCRDGIDRIVFSAWQLDGSIIERIYAADNAKHDIQGRLDKTNEKARQEVQRRYKDRMEEANEVAHSVLKSPKSTYVFKDENGNTIKFS